MKPAKELANAAAAGDLQKVKVLVAGAPALAKDWQPIMDGSFFGQTEVVRLLLKHGADPNVPSKSAHHYRPLHRLVEHKITFPRGPQHEKTIKILLEHGADPMLRGTCAGHTAIAVAALGGETQFLPSMLEHVPGDRDIFTATVLGDGKRVQSLLKKNPALAKAKDENGWTALRYAVASQAGKKDTKITKSLPAIAEALLSAGAEASGVLDQSCWANNEGMVKLLLARGAKLENGDTLNHAACDGNFKLLDLLLAHGADLRDTRGTEHHGGYIPFGCAVTMRSLQGVKWFLDHGADPNDVGGKRGETALHVAVSNQCGEPLLELLVERGVKVGARDADGRTALSIAESKGQKKAVEFLRISESGRAVSRK